MFERRTHQGGAAYLSAVCVAIVAAFGAAIFIMSFFMMRELFEACERHAIIDLRYTRSAAGQQSKLWWGAKDEEDLGFGAHFVGGPL